jgi:hypothetical protein
LETQLPPMDAVARHSHLPACSSHDRGDGRTNK